MIKANHYGSPLFLHEKLTHVYVHLIVNTKGVQQQLG